MRCNRLPAPLRSDDVCLESVATFGRLAERYAEKYFHLDLYDRFLARFAQRIGPGASVLDAACGPGNVCAYLARTRPDLRLLGIDLAQGMIEQARRRVPCAQFLLKDCRRVDELGRRFDAAVFAFGLSYLTDEDANRFFAALNASLSESAVLFLSTITGEAAHSGFATTDSGDRVFLIYRSPEAVAAMVERAGYRVDFMELIASPANASLATQDVVLIAQRTTPGAAQA